MTTLSSLVFAPGTIVTGKWRGRQYRLDRLIGEGANGKVYLAARDGEYYALKVGMDAADHQADVNVLQALARSSEHYRRFLVDADDYQSANGDYPFYVMRLVRGSHLPEFIRQRGRDWLGLAGANLLRSLRELHSRGWIFGDLKKDNVMVSGYGEIELVDFGGATPKGRAIKQFTELYDRGYWNAGSRTADEGYDVFAFAVLMLQCLNEANSCFSPHILPQNRTPEMLFAAVERSKPPTGMAAFLHKALAGGFASSQEAYTEWKRLVCGSIGSSGMIAGIRKTPWPQVCFYGALALFLAAVYYMLQ